MADHDTFTLVAEPTIGCICSNPHYHACLCALLEEKCANHPTIGRIGKHFVVVHHQSNDLDPIETTVCALNLARTFKSVEIILILGEAAGVPSDSHDIRLGDVVVGTTIVPLNIPSYRSQHSEFQPLAHLQGPRIGQDLARVVHDMCQQNPKMADAYVFPDSAHDNLWRSGVIVEREVRQDPRYPVVHYGSIGYSRTQLIGERPRERLRAEYDVLSVGTQGVRGLARPWLFIQGISNYADNDNKKRWAAYAAANTAAYAVILIHLLPDRWQNILNERVRGDSSCQKGYSKTSCDSTGRLPDQARLAMRTRAASDELPDQANLPMRPKVGSTDGGMDGGGGGDGDGDDVYDDVDEQEDPTANCDSTYLFPDQSELSIRPKAAGTDGDDLPGTDQEWDYVDGRTETSEMFDDGYLVVPSSK